MMQTWRKLSVPCIWLLGQTPSSHGNSLSDNNLRRLAVPFGRATDRRLECAFLDRLSDDISQLLRASSRLDELGIDELRARA